MSTPTYITQDRHGDYLFHIAVPKSLRQTFNGRQSIRQSVSPYGSKASRRLAAAAEELLGVTREKYQQERFKHQLTL